MRAIVGCFVLLASAGAVLADEGEQIARDAQKCWSLMDLETAKGFSADVDAKVDEGGEAEFRIRTYEPATPSGRVMSEAARRTLMKCAPYDVPPGRYRFTMVYDDAVD